MESEAIPFNAGTDITQSAAKRRAVAAIALRFRCKFFDVCGFGWPSSPPPAAVRASKQFGSHDTAAAAVQDGDTLMLAGLAGNQMITGFYCALLRRWRRTRTPRGLTLVCHGGNGGRGKLPLSVDDVLSVKGLVSRLIVAHLDTHALAKRRMQDPHGGLEVHVMPLGVMSLIYDRLGGEGLALSNSSFTTTTGISTDWDPRTGRGTALTLSNSQLVVESGDPLTNRTLTYTLPSPSLTVLNAAAADRKGNIYSRGMPTISDGKPAHPALHRTASHQTVRHRTTQYCRFLSRYPPTSAAVEIARAVRRHDGMVIVLVGLLVEEGYGTILLHSHDVDMIVVDAWTEQAVRSAECGVRSAE